MLPVHPRMLPVHPRMLRVHPRMLRVHPCMPVVRRQRSCMLGVPPACSGGNGSHRQVAVGEAITKGRSAS
jgi:hypothetical protein